MAAVEDVTANLPSLQFEAALTREEKYAFVNFITYQFARTSLNFLGCFIAGKWCIYEEEVMLSRSPLVHKRKYILVNFKEP